MGSEFIYAQPVKIFFGEGKFAQLGSVLEELGVSRCVIACGRYFAPTAEAMMEKDPRIVAVFGNVEQNPQLSGVIETTRLARENKADAVIGIGGGSSIDTAKFAAAIALDGHEAIEYYRGDRPFPTQRLAIIAVRGITAGNRRGVSDSFGALDEKDVPLCDWFEARTGFRSVLSNNVRALLAAQMFLSKDEALSAALAGTELPAEGNMYRASVEALEAVPCMEDIRRRVFGEMDIQAGFCNGHGYTLNALEYHKCSEVNYTTTGLVLLLALPSDVKDGHMDSSAVLAFYLPPETLVEIYPGTLHFAPCRTEEEGFNCLVVLEKGVNAPLERVDTSAPGEEKLLWMRGKWMLCHADSPQAQKGAFVGISGENLTLRI